jgi:glycosyl transferase family 2
MTGENNSIQLDFSILIGMVSTEDERRILEALDILRQQQGNYSYEVIIGDRRNDDVSVIISKNYPEVKLLPADAGTSLPVLRTSALEHASGKYIIVTEDHCVPSTDWLSSFYQAFEDAPDDTMAVGGCVENGVFDSRLDWATFFCEYSFFLQPVHEGVGNTLPGMNVAYRRDVFQNVNRETLTSGFWETTLHPQLINQNHKLFSTNKIKLFHSKKFSLKLFLCQRFIYSRYYAGLRFKSSQYSHRLLACCATVLLPPLLLYRMIKQIRAKNRLRKELLSASPYLTLFVLIWAAGEMWGYVFGAGKALAAIE